MLILDYRKGYSSPDFVGSTGAKVVKPQRLKLNLFDVSNMEGSMARSLPILRRRLGQHGIGPVPARQA